MFESFGSIAEKIGDGFKLTPQPPGYCRQGGSGLPRQRNSDIRRPHADDCPDADLPSWRVTSACTCGKKRRGKRNRLSLAEKQAYWRTGRQPRQKKPRRHPARMEFLLDMLSGDAIQTWTVDRQAPQCYQIHAQTLRTWIREAEELGFCKRSENQGGRSRGLTLAVDHIKLGQFLRRAGEIDGEASPQLENLSPSPTPLSEDRSRSGSASGERGPNHTSLPDTSGKAVRPHGQERLRRQETEILKPKWPTSKPEILAELAHGDRIQHPSAQRHYRMGTMRRAAGQAGLPLRFSKLVVAAFLQATAAIGKAAKRDDLAKAVILRLVYEGLCISREIDGAVHADVIQSWPELLSWIHGCERWLALRQLERAAERSAGLAQTRHTDAPGRVFDRDPISQYPYKSPVRSEISPTVPRTLVREERRSAEQLPPNLIPREAYKNAGKSAPLWLTDRLKR